MKSISHGCITVSDIHVNGMKTTQSFPQLRFDFSHTKRLYPGLFDHTQAEHHQRLQQFDR